MPIEDRLLNETVKLLDTAISSLSDSREQIVALLGERLTRSDKRFSDEDRAAVGKALRALNAKYRNYLVFTARMCLRAVRSADDDSINHLCTTLELPPEEAFAGMGEVYPEGGVERPGGAGLTSFARRRRRQS